MCGVGVGIGFWIIRHGTKLADIEYALLVDARTSNPRYWHSRSGAMDGGLNKGS